MSTTFTCSDDGGHIYSRITNPTRDRAETLLGAVESSPTTTAHAVLYSSGLAATFAALGRLLPERVAIAGGYHGTHQVLDQLRRLSGNTLFASVPLPSADELLAQAEAPSGSLAPLGKGDVLWIETPKNPTCDVADISAYVAAAQALGGVRVVVDGTFAPPPLQRPLDLGADVVMHSTTKALCGHSDAIGGALCVADAEMAAALRADRTALGSTPGNLEAWLLTRSLRTLHLRVQRQSTTATALAAWLQRAVDGEAGHPLAGYVASVRHPSLPADPSHAIAARQMSGGFGGCFAIELTSEPAARALPAALGLFRDATSLGGVESLIEWRRKYDDAISPTLLRLSVGLEEEEDLREDLRRAILHVSEFSRRSHAFNAPLD